MRAGGAARFLLLTVIPCLIQAGTALADQPWSGPTISIIIDDIGYRHQDDQRAIHLPGPLAYAVLPHSPHGEAMSILAHGLGKDVLLHLPMQAVADHHNRFLGPGALTMEMPRDEFLRTVDTNLRSIPHAIGVNNHMGSLLTRDSDHMEWLMQTLWLHNKFYIDSVTSHRTVAGKAALINRVPYLRRDIFLDNEKSEGAVLGQFRRLVDLAKRRGSAIAIGHPHDETIAVLERELPRLDRYGVSLVSIREVVFSRAAGAAVTPASLAR